MTRYSLSVLTALVMAATVAANGASGRLRQEGKHRVWPGVLRAVIVRNEHERNTLVLRSGRRVWSTRADVATCIRDGAPADLAAFRAGETVAVQSSERTFERVSTVSDTRSFAAFLRYDDFIGHFKVWNAANTLLTIRGTGAPMLPHAYKLTPWDQTYRVTPGTKFLLGGKRVPRDQAIRTLSDGREVHVVERFEDLTTEPSEPTRAYAVFDMPSWRAFADEELRRPREVFRPAVVTILGKPSRAD